MSVDKKKLNKVSQELLKANNIALFCHQDPDEDALGSCGALKIALKKLGKKVEIFCEDKVKDNLEYLGVKLCDSKEELKNFDTFCLVDGCGAYRTGSFEPYFNKASKRLCIDHHQVEEYTFDCAYQDPSCSSASDIVVEVISLLGVEFDAQMATLLYAGITADTGRFLYPSSTPEDSLNHASLMIKFGADRDKVNFNCFRRKDKDYPLFLKRFLKNTKTYFDGKVFFTTIRHREYSKYKDMWENNNLPKTLDWVDGCEVVVVAVEKEKGYFHLGFRSIGDINVGNIARKFGGGGHKNASGGEYFGSFLAMKKTLLGEFKFLCR